MWQLPGCMLIELHVKSTAKSVSILLVHGSRKPVPFSRPCLHIAVLRTWQDCRPTIILKHNITGLGLQAAAVRRVLLQAHALSLSGMSGVWPGLELKGGRCLALCSGPEAGASSAEVGLPCPASAVTVGALYTQGPAASGP